MLMKNRIVKFVVLVCCLCSMPGIVRAQLSVHQFDQLMKKIDDVLWYEKVGDIAYVDKVILCWTTALEGVQPYFDECR